MYHKKSHGVKVYKQILWQLFALRMAQVELSSLSDLVLVNQAEVSLFDHLDF